MKRLDTDTLPNNLAPIGYDRGAVTTGIVHLGIGAFHRAHQAVYTDAALQAEDHRWGICGVSLRSSGVRDRLSPQHGLYTVTQRSAGCSATQLIGAVREVLVGSHQSAAVIARLAAPATRVVTITVTEKGYYRAPDGGLDSAAEPITADLAGRGAPRTIYGFMRQGLAQRRAAGLPGLSAVSCDNMPENGALLARLFSEYLDWCDPALGAWFRANCCCPSTMVDRIVPATTADDLDEIAGRIGVRDEGAVITEPFSQWAIEDHFAGPRPRWEVGGAQFVEDVRPYELAKLRMLNGAHSALAYIGLARRHQYVHQAIADPAIRPLVESLMRDEAGPTLPVDINVAAYADRLIERFANPALAHRLTQIATDGSQKIPQRWLQTLACHQRQSRSCPAILTALAAWIDHIRGANGPVDDPLAETLAQTWRKAGVNGIVDELFGERGRFASHWHATLADQAVLRSRLDISEMKRPSVKG